MERPCRGFSDCEGVEEVEAERGEVWGSDDGDAVWLVSGLGVVMTETRMGGLPEASSPLPSLRSPVGERGETTGSGGMTWSTRT